MLLSRSLAKARIARGERPGWIAAWAPVGFDTGVVVFIYVLAYGPFQSVVETQDWPIWLIVLTLFLCGFVPTQAVLIISSLWASKSRFKDIDAS